MECQQFFFSWLIWLNWTMTMTHYDPMTQTHLIESRRVYFCQHISMFDRTKMNDSEVKILYMLGFV